MGPDWARPELNGLVPIYRQKLQSEDLHVQELRNPKLDHLVLCVSRVSYPIFWDNEDDADSVQVKQQEMGQGPPQHQMEAGYLKPNEECGMVSLHRAKKVQRRHALDSKRNV